MERVVGPEITGDQIGPPGMTPLTGIGTINLTQIPLRNLKLLSRARPIPPAPPSPFGRTDNGENCVALLSQTTDLKPGERMIQYMILYRAPLDVVYTTNDTIVAIYTSYE